MPTQPVRVFLASSSSPDAMNVLSLLTEALERHATRAGTRIPLDVKPWPDRFAPSSSIERTIASLLDSCEFFVAILTPDAKSIRITSGQERMVCNQNVLFEAGAAYGRYGLARMFLVKDPAVTLPNDLDGILTIHLDTASENLKTHVERVAGEIVRLIEKSRDSVSDNRLRWLSLMKCKPALQNDVIQWIRRLEPDAAKHWDIQYERYGVLWGPPDDFLLFSAPNVNNFIAFVTHLRARFGASLQQVDSRMVFPKKYWQQREPSDPELKASQLVLLSCAPECVELAYEALLVAARDEKAKGIRDVDIVTVGIATGDADLFFITAAKNEQSHRSFIETQLHRDILQPNWLVDNTTSLVIT